MVLKKNGKGVKVEGAWKEWWEENCGWGVMYERRINKFSLCVCMCVCVRMLAHMLVSVCECVHVCAHYLCQVLVLSSVLLERSLLFFHSVRQASLPVNV